MRRAPFRHLVSCIGAAVLLAGSSRPGGRVQSAGSDPFEFFAPWIVVSKAERARLDSDHVLARVLPGKDAQLAVFVATRLDAAPDALEAWTRAIAELKRSRFVQAIGRFSDPPTPTDLERLSLDEGDLEAIRRCRPGACGLKLSADEIEALRATVARAGAGWRDAVQRTFRELLVERIVRYRAGGLAALSPPADRMKPGRPDDALSAIVAQSPYLKRLPRVVEWLVEYPDANATLESFFYWSKEHYGDGKPVISITHVGIARPESNDQLPAIVVVGKQIFATHYLEGSLGLTIILRDAADGASYLAYVNRSQVDLLRGFFGGFMRGVLENRVGRHAPVIVRGLRARLESGHPSSEPPGSFTGESSRTR